MIHPASDKILALSVVAGEPLVQGSVLRFIDHGDGRMKALVATAAGDVSDMGTFLAYQISPDSEDVEFIGAPESTDFTLSTDTGVGGGTNAIVSGTECVALGGSKVALIRLDANAVNQTDLTGFAPSDIMQVDATSGLLDTVASGDIDVTAAKVVQHDTVTMVVLLA